ALQGHVPLELRMYLPAGCSLSSANAATPLLAVAGADTGNANLRSFRSTQNSVELQAQCRGL
ncbi:MAG: hypothetical protein J0H24_19330, partial [Delftia acidovorans]|nr:hypothetical protein [Delftia acidovorans]